MPRSGQSNPPLFDIERMATALVDAAPTALYVFDLIGRSPVFVSPRGPEILGLDPATVEGLGIDFLPRIMHPDDLARIFERFHRGGNVAGIAGTGIGLAGAKQIVAQHGGTITVASAEGQGSTFTVRLPR